MTQTTTTCATPGNHRTFEHIKACTGCRDNWPMIADILDGMTEADVRKATLETVLEQGMRI